MNSKNTKASEPQNNFDMIKNNSPIKVFVSDYFTPESLILLMQKNEFKISFEITEDLSQAQAVLIRSKTTIDKDFLKKAPMIQLIITATSGFDHIDFNLTKAAKITVMYTPSANTQSAAELAILLILSALRKVGEIQKVIRAGEWKASLTQGNEFKNKTLGIIGLGRVGTRVAEIAQSFGATVIAHDPYQDDNVFKKLNISRLGLTEVFSQSDILSLHVPLTEETRRLIRSETLELTKDGLILINTSRGKVIDEGALLQALDSKEIVAAGLDVFEHEPLARDSRLRKMPQVIITPHVGAFTEEAFLSASQEAVQKLILYFQKGETSDLLN